MGFIVRDELIASLNELLEAERAGVRIAIRSLRDAESRDDRMLLRRIQCDEARWCEMLFLEIRRLGETPSKKIGAFHDKAMAISDLEERLAFLNRGQGWVVRKLKAILPKVRDEELYRNLRAMLDGHHINIEVVNERTQQPATAEPQRLGQS